MNIMGCRNVTESMGLFAEKPPHFIGIGVSVARPLCYGSLQCPKPLAQMSDPPQCCAALLDLYDRIRFDSMCRRSAPSDHSQIASFASGSLMALVVLVAIALPSTPAHADWLQRLLQFNILAEPDVDAADDPIGPTLATETPTTIPAPITPMEIETVGPARTAIATPTLTPAPERAQQNIDQRPQNPLNSIRNIIRQPRPQLALLPADLGQENPAILSRLTADVYDAIVEEPNSSSLPVISRLEIKPGGSFYAILQSFGINATERRAAAAVINEEFPLNKLQAGWQIQVSYDASIAAGEDGRLLGVAFNPTNFETVSMRRAEDGFSASFEKDDIALVTIRYQGTIKVGLWKDLQAVGFSNRMIQKFHSALSKRVNVDKEIKPGARYEMVMEAQIRETGEIIASGNVLYASVEVGDLSQQDSKDLTKEAYYFEPPTARAGWFTPAGKSLTSGVTFLRRPAEGRISSHFNPRRKNPVTGKVSPHNGVDIAAPTGTPIVASAAGRIVQRRTYGSFGKFIEIDHGGGWRTRYAHMDSYKSGLSRGSSVRQGQVIGYIGSTGRSTGPHLHFEIRKNGAARDPIRASLPENITLTGADRTAFNRHKNHIAGLRSNALLFGEDVFVDME